MIDELKWQHLERAVVDKSDAGPKIHILKPPNSLDCCKLAARLRKSECEPAYLLFADLHLHFARFSNGHHPAIGLSVQLSK
jgi:hypothetical protein